MLQLQTQGSAAALLDGRTGALDLQATKLWAAVLLKSPKSRAKSQDPEIAPGSIRSYCREAR